MIGTLYRNTVRTLRHLAICPDCARHTANIFRLERECNALDDELGAAKRELQRLEGEFDELELQRADYQRKWTEARDELTRILRKNPTLASR